MSHPARPFATALLLGVFAGCADTHWERALYEGMRQGERPCQRSTADHRLACEPLPAYDIYEAERRKAQGGSAR